TPVTAEAAKPETAKPGDNAKPEAAKPGDNPKPETAKPAETPKTAEAPANPNAPLYALGVGLLELALEGKQQENGAFGQAIIAEIYLDWLKNEPELKVQPVDRDKARQEIETRLKRATEIDNYNAQYHAERGLNLAWL